MVDDAAQAVRQLVDGSDVPSNAPPSDVETWNSGEIEEFPSTNRSVSMSTPLSDAWIGGLFDDWFLDIANVLASRSLAHDMDVRSHQRYTANGTSTGNPEASEAAHHQFSL